MSCHLAESVVRAVAAVGSREARGGERLLPLAVMGHPGGAACGTSRAGAEGQEARVVRERKRRKCESEASLTGPAEGWCYLLWRPSVQGGACNLGLFWVGLWLPTAHRQGIHPSNYHLHKSTPTDSRMQTMLCQQHAPGCLRARGAAPHLGRACRCAGAPSRCSHRIIPCVWTPPPDCTALASIQSLLPHPPAYVPAPAGGGLGWRCPPSRARLRWSKVRACA